MLHAGCWAPQPDKLQAPMQCLVTASHKHAIRMQVHPDWWKRSVPRTVVSTFIASRSLPLGFSANFCIDKTCLSTQASLNTAAGCWYCCGRQGMEQLSSKCRQEAATLNLAMRLYCRLLQIDLLGNNGCTGLAVRVLATIQCTADKPVCKCATDTTNVTAMQAETDRDNSLVVYVHQPEVRCSLIVNRQTTNSDVCSLVSVVLNKLHVVHTVPAGMTLR